jgi:L-aminopeptidase/D-esterase-like protein
MGEKAAAAASTGPVEEGCVGAGTGATVGKILGMEQAMKSGIGTATVRLHGRFDGVLVSALVACNAVGDVRDPKNSQIIAGARKSKTSGEFVDAAEAIRGTVSMGLRRENTTLAVVATNARLTKLEATKVAQLASIGVARTISPVHMMSDGDIVFALSMGTAQASVDSVGVAAAAALSEAILRSVRMAKSMGGLPGLAG